MPIANRPVRVAFRADASRAIGHGHVMRCLALADALRAAGAECRFLCATQPGHLMETIVAHGHAVVPLPIDDASRWEDDASLAREALAGWQAHWLVVDHYGLDHRWETQLADVAGRIAVIDDLVDRNHACALLVDQTLGRDALDYASRVPADSRVLAGADYAMLRPEFAAMREHSLVRRRNATLRRVLVSVGGVDARNAAGLVLEALAGTSLPSDATISVALTNAAPHIATLRTLAAGMPWRTEIRVDVADMAAVLAETDLAIGAAGTSSWERCCLGVPSIALIVAENQRDVARSLADAGAAYLIDDLAMLEQQLPDALEKLSPSALASMSAAASRVTDGLGTARVVAAMEACHA